MFVAVRVFFIVSKVKKKEENETEAPERAGHLFSFQQ